MANLLTVIWVVINLLGGFILFSFTYRRIVLRKEKEDPIGTECFLNFAVWILGGVDIVLLVAIYYFSYFKG